MSYSGDQPPIGGYGSSAGYLDAASTLISSGLDYAGNRETNKTNKQLAADAQKYDYDKWREMNKYNSPSEQMLRLKQAGLNPNLVYGSGNVTGNVTGGQAKATKATVKNELGNIALPKPLQMLSQFQDMRRKEAEIDNIGANTEYTNTKKSNEDIKSLLLGIKADAEPELVKSQVSAAEAKAYKLREENQKLLPQKIKQATSEADIKKAEADMQQKLKPLGLTQNDNVFIRLFLNAIIKAQGGNKLNLNFE